MEKEKIIQVKVQKVLKRVISFMMAVIILVTGINLTSFITASAIQQVELYFVDNTDSHWVCNDNAVLELVDNSNGHTKYVMTQKSDQVWSVTVPESAYNITFNRYNSDMTVQWNSWSAGGRDTNDAYYADGSEYGHWQEMNQEITENYFHEGDVVYLDYSEFTAWGDANAKMYINFNVASKTENNGNDIVIKSADSELYHPVSVENSCAQYIYQYTVKSSDIGSKELRFWRGNSETLWNCSGVLTYEEYKQGTNCVKISGWDEMSSLYFYEFEIDKDKDSDGDGLPDYYEIQFGTNKNNIDTDGDNLTDYEELNIIFTDPVKSDSNSNGIIDGEDDLDGDGISNREEIDLGINPLSSDSDGDNLTDYEEVYVYGSNPLLTDTDGDGLSDYDDVLLDFSPLLTDTDGNGILDPDEKTQQVVMKDLADAKKAGVTQVDVVLAVSGNAEKHVQIADVYGMDKLSSDVEGLVGVPVEISCDLPFDRASIRFTYDENQLGDVNEEDLAILWYDEENNWYQILDEDCVLDKENNTVTYVTTHFSTYMLVDRKSWYNAWRENIDYRNSTEGESEKTYFDIAFIVDCSGSMGGQSMTMTKTAMNNFVSAMEEKDEAAIIKFTGSASFICDFTSEQEKLKKTIKGLTASGGTDVNQGLLMGLNVFHNHECDKQKIAVLICDGDVNYVSSTIQSYVENNIQIYAINVASASAHKSLQQMADLTGGQYYYGSSATMLETIFASVRDETIEKIDPTDKDGDELYDIYERAGMKLPNGKIIYTSPEKADTDGDNLTDLQETGLVYNVDKRYIGNGQYYNVKYFQLKSDPTKKDTDGDGVQDDLDEKPWEKDCILVAELDNKFFSSDYLRIVDGNGGSSHGGNQSWWEVKCQNQESQDERESSDAQELSAEVDRIQKLLSDKYFWLWKMGCGVIAMSDMELYLSSQSGNYIYNGTSIAKVNEENGECAKMDYMQYVEQQYATKYSTEGDLIDCFLGLNPIKMMSGLNTFFQEKDGVYKNILWAKHTSLGRDMEKEAVLNDIENMLENNIPVVFAVYDIKGEKIRLYNDLQEAKTNSGIIKDINSHYMTITGLYKCAGDTLADETYILKVVSWGTEYYINYDQYAEKLSYFNNILSVH